MTHTWGGGGALGEPISAHWHPSRLPPPIATLYLWRALGALLAEKGASLIGALHATVTWHNPRVYLKGARMGGALVFT
jgi:hypothetical protein